MVETNMNELKVGKEFVLNLAPNGMVPTKSLTPFVPITPDEIVRDITTCMEVGGITYVHLHARDEHGVPTGDSNVYAKYIEAIRNRFEDLMICVSCSGRIDPSFKGRSAVLDLKGDVKPDMASLTLSSLNFAKTASVNTPETIIQLADKMLDNGIVPELEIFDVGMLNYAQYLIKKGHLKPTFYFNIILGNIFSAQTKMSHVAAILSELPEDALWSMGGIGNAQVLAHMMAFSQGGGIRTGIEDNMWLDDAKKMLATNAALVKRVHDLAAITDSKMMDGLTFKKMIQSHECLAQ